MLDKSLRGLLAGGTIRSGLELTGLFIKGEIQKAISDGINAEPPQGVDLQSGKTPLIDTGQLRNSIDYEVEA